MSSTEFVADRRDILFQLLEVYHAGQLCELEQFKDFSADDFEMIIQEACTFAEKVTAPINKSGDEQGCKAVDGKVQTPAGFREAWIKMGENGWLGMDISPEFGGQGLPALVTSAAREAIMASNQGFFLTNILTTGSANLIKSFGSEQQKADYCEKMYNGTWSGTMCLTEPSAGSAVGDITTTAEPKGGYYSIKGTKQFITSGEHDYCDNIIHLVLARTPGAPAGPKGISLFIVPKFRLDGTPNDVTLVGIEHKMGLNGSPTCMLSFGEAGECHGYLLQEECRGMAQMFQMMNEARLQVALQGLAGSAAATHNAHAYANERVQGIPVQHGKDQKAPRTLIVEHPDVRRMLMNMKSTTEGLRGMMYTTAYYTDMAHNGPEDEREYYQDLVDIMIPIVKSFGTDQGFEVASTGISVLGGVGYTKDFPLEQCTRDLKIAQIYEGTNGIQALDLTTRKFNLKNGQLVQNLLNELRFFEKQNELPIEIETLVEEWKGYKNELTESIQAMQKMMQQNGPRAYVLYACNMLNVMGDVVCAFELLRNALVAAKKLRAIAGDSNQEEILAENPDAKFYYNKIRSAEHYVHALLPRVLMNARVIKNANLASLKAKLED